MQKLIDQFNKNSVEIVKVHIQEWKSQNYFDLRVWNLDYPAEDGSERPTHKGITLNVEFLPKLIQALTKTQKIIEKKVEFGPERPQEPRSQRG